MTTQSEISKAIKEIKHFLQNSLTPEFFISIKSTSATIAELLEDPSIDIDTASSLASLSTRLKEASKQGHVADSLDLMAEIQKKLSEVDSPLVNRLLESIKLLLEEAKEAQLIEHFVTAMEAAKSIGEFFDMSEKFGEIAIDVLGDYGVYVPIIGKVLHQIASIYQEDEAKNVARQNKEFSAFNLLVNLQMLRGMHLTDYERITLNINAGAYGIDTPFLHQMTEERDYASRALQASPRMKIETLNILQLLNGKLEKLLSHFVVPEIKNESLHDVLDNIGASYPKYMNNFLKYVVYSSQSLPYGRPPKPELSPYERNYRGICTYYGKKQIDSIMKGLVTNFVNNGGDDLYYALANSFENAPDVFIEFTHFISLPQLNLEHNNKVPDYIKKMSEYFHLGAEQYIQAKWKKTIWPIGLEYLKKQLGVNEADSNLTIELIKVRAFMEFCHKTSSYFFGYHYVGRDIGKGLLDIPTGLINTVTNPGSAITGVCNLLTLEGWANIGTSIWNRPLRFTASITPGLAVGAYASFNAFTPSVHTVNTINKAHLLHQVGSPLSTLHTSVVGSQSLAMVTTSTGVNTVATTSLKRDKSENVEFKVNKVEVATKNGRGWDKLWVLLLPDLAQAKTAMDFYEMLNTLSQELAYHNKSCEPISQINISKNRFFSSSKTPSSGPDESSQLVSLMHHSK